MVLLGLRPTLLGAVAEQAVLVDQQAAHQVPIVILDRRDLELAAGRTRRQEAALGGRELVEARLRVLVELVPQDLMGQRAMAREPSRFALWCLLT